MCRAVNEVNAAIIVGFLKNVSIHASYSPNIGVKGRTPSCEVYVQKDKLEEALKMLKEQGLIVF